MRQLGMIAGLIALGLATTGGAVGLATAGGDEPKAGPLPRSDDPKTAGQPGPTRPEPPLAEKLDRLKSEYEAPSGRIGTLYRGSTIPEENLAKAAEMRPDYPAVVRRIADLAATAPKDPAVRDAMLWMIEQTGRAGTGLYAGEFALAATWLVRHFGDDPDAVRVGLDLDNWPNAHRDILLLNFYASAKGRESKGLARLALAQYLERKAMMADGARKLKGRPTITHDDIVRADGTLYTVKEVMPDDEYAYILHLKQCDVGYLRAEADRLYEEVIAEYGDVPYVRARDRLLEALLRQPEPKLERPAPHRRRPPQDAGRDGSPPLDARPGRRRPARRLAQPGRRQAGARDPGGRRRRQAPGSRRLPRQGRGPGLLGHRVRPAVMRDIPREKALVERMKGRPFAMLGINVDADASAARKVIEAQGVTWPNWHDGEPGEGPIAKLYHVRRIPDRLRHRLGRGKIRSRWSRGDELDQLVEKLVAEQETAGN